MASSSDSSKATKVVLVTSDKQEFEVDMSMAIQSKTIKAMVEEDECSLSSIPLPNVHSSTLRTLIEEYLSKHDEKNKLSKEDLKKSDSKFLEKPISELLNIVMAANYLDIKDLLDMTSQKIADTIKDYSVEQVREVFAIQNDFTPEEEAAAREENAWAFE